MRLTPTRPSRTRRELRREGIAAVSCPDHEGPGDPVLQSALLAIEAHPQEPEEQSRDAGEVAPAPRHAARRRRPIAVDVDDLDAHDPHAKRAADDDLEYKQVGETDRAEQYQPRSEERRVGKECRS